MDLNGCVSIAEPRRMFSSAVAFAMSAFYTAISSPKLSRMKKCDPITRQLRTVYGATTTASASANAMGNASRGRAFCSSAVPVDDGVREVAGG